MSIIPRIIHQTWKSRDLPADFQVYQQSWINHHPDWQYRFYDDNNCRSFVKESYPDLLDIYDNYPKQIQRIDMFRYLIIHTYGGLYADMDMECHKPLDSLLSNKTIVFSIEAHLTARRQQELGYKESYQIANCIFAAAPAQAFFDKIIEKLREMASEPVNGNNDVEDTTGPRMLTRLIDSLESNERKEIVILKQLYLMSTGYPDIFPFNLRMHARHHNAGTWKTEGEPLSLKRIWIERNKLPPLW